MITFYLIRHAEREGDQTLLAGRMPGLHLTAPGRVAADRVAGRLAAEPITQVLSSPMERARETAEPIARRLGLELEVRPELDEIDFGRWTGRTFHDLDATDEHWRLFNRVRSFTRIPGGEAMVEVQARFVALMLRLQEASPNGGIALVSHGDPIKMALACFLGAPLDVYSRLEVGLASVSVVTLDDQGGKVIRLNEAPPTVTARG